MLSKGLKITERTNSISLFVERNPEQDYRLDLYYDLLNDLKIENKEIRLFEKYEIYGLSQEEILSVNFQVFSTLNLDQIVDPTELFDQGYILPFAYKNQEADIKTLSAKKLLQLYFPYRDLDLRRTEILIFKDDLADAEKKALTTHLKKNSSVSKTSLRNQGFVVSAQNDFTAELEKVELQAEEDLKSFKLKQKLNMPLTNLSKLRTYYRRLENDPTNLELIFWDEYCQFERVYHGDLKTEEIEKENDPKIYENALVRITSLAKHNFTWSSIKENDLILRVGSRLDQKRMASSLENLGLNRYNQGILELFIKNSKAISLCKQVYDLSIQPLLTTLMSLPRNVVLNLDILSFFGSNISLNHLLINTLTNQLLIIISPEDRNKFFKAAYQYDIEAQVLGKVGKNQFEEKSANKDKTPGLQIYYHGKKIINLPKNLSFIPNQKTFTLVNINKKMIASLKKQKRSKTSQKNNKCSGKTNKNIFKKTNKYFLDKQILLLQYPGSKDSYLFDEYFEAVQVEYKIHNINLLNNDRYQNSIQKLLNLLGNADFLILPDADQIKDQFIATDKLLTILLENGSVKNAIHEFLANDGKILAFGNAFEALIQCGLLPYGRYRNWGDLQGYFYPDIVSQDPLQFSKLLFLPPELWEYCLNEDVQITYDENQGQENILAMLDSNCQILGSQLDFDKLLEQNQEIVLDFLEEVSLIENSLTEDSKD